MKQLLVVARVTVFPPAVDQLMLFFEVLTLFLFALQANEAAGEHGACLVDEAASAPPTGAVLV